MSNFGYKKRKIAVDTMQGITINVGNVGGGGNDGGMVTHPDGVTISTPDNLEADNDGATIIMQAGNAGRNGGQITINAGNGESGIGGLVQMGSGASTNTGSGEAYVQLGQAETGMGSPGVMSAGGFPATGGGTNSGGEVCVDGGTNTIAGGANVRGGTPGLTGIGGCAFVKGGDAGEDNTDAGCAQLEGGDCGEFNGAGGDVLITSGKSGDVSGGNGDVVITANDVGGGANGALKFIVNSITYNWPQTGPTTNGHTLQVASGGGTSTVVLEWAA